MSYKISGKLLKDYQKRILLPLLRGEKKHLMLINPRRSGKSVMVFYMVNYLINKYYLDHGKPSNALIMAPKASQCRNIYIENILDDGRKLIDIANAKFIESRLTLEYKFGSRIKFSGSDLVDNAIGQSSNVIVLDEYALGKSDAFNRLYPMVNYSKGNFIISSTPRGKNHLYKLFQQLKINKDWLVVHENVLSLKLMTLEEYEAIPMSRNLKEQEFMTSWESPYDNAIYDKPNIAKLSFVKSNRVILSCDLGMRDATAILLAQIDGTTINIIHSQEYVNMSFEDTINDIRRYCDYYGIVIDEWLVPHDTSKREHLTGKSRLDYLIECGYNTNLVTKCGIMDGIELVRKHWSNIIFNEDTIAIERLKAYVMDKETERPQHDINSHMADALRYLIVGIMMDNDIIEYKNYYNNRRVI